MSKQAAKMGNQFTNVDPDRIGTYDSMQVGLIKENLDRRAQMLVDDAKQPPQEALMRHMVRRRQFEPARVEELGLDVEAEYAEYQKRIESSRRATTLAFWSYYLYTFGIMLAVGFWMSYFFY